MKNLQVSRKMHGLSFSQKAHTENILLA